MFKIILKLKRFWYNIQCFFERGKKGYCWRDVMDLDCFLINLLPNMLEEFNQKRNGYPGRLVLKHPDLSDDERSAIAYAGHKRCETSGYSNEEVIKQLLKMILKKN